MSDFNSELLERMIDRWVGEKDNPLSGKTFAEIVWLGEHYGVDLGGLKENDIATK